MGTRSSVKRHRELSICGINLWFDICFVVVWCCVFKFTFLPVSERHPLLLIQHFTCLAEGRCEQLAAMESCKPSRGQLNLALCRFTKPQMGPGGLM